MTILFITHYSGFYGANKSMLQLILNLREYHKIEPIVLLPTDGVFVDVLESKGIKYKVIHYYWWVHQQKGVFQYFLNKRKQLRNFFRVSKIIDQLPEIDSIDLVYSNSVTINIGVFIARRLRKPHIWHFRESLSQFNLSLSLSLSLSLYIWNNSVTRRYILISDYMLDYYKSYLPQDRVVRIYNGIKEPLELRERNIVYNDIVCFVCVGVICEQKNQMDILRAISHLKSSKISGFKCIFIGSHKDDYLQLLNSYIKDNNIEEFVEFRGHQDNVMEHLSQCNVGLMTSRDEAFGRVTIEYMLNRIPVIASISGANEELVESGSNGFLYSIYQTDQLAESMLYFINNRKEVEVLGTNAQQFALSNFTDRQNSKLIYEQIQKVIQ